jgi:cation diffusion facilitator CzcD-associated flavoprotein CzcO
MTGRPGRPDHEVFMISAVGAFLAPKRDTGIAGLERFAGKIQEPARWDHGYAIAGAGSP